MHSLLLHKVLRQIASEDRNHCNDCVESDDEHHSCSGRSLVSELILEIGRSPEKIEPPYTVCEELTCNERPCLTVSKALEERNSLSLLLFCRSISHLVIILKDILKLGLVYML